MTKHLILMSIALGCCTAAPADMPPPAPAATAAALPAPDAAEHPFLQHEGYPRWSRMSGERAVRDTKYALERAQQRRAAICAVVPEAASYDNTFGAFESLCDDVELATAFLANLSMTTDSPELRAAEEELTPLVSAFESGLSADAGLWAVFKSAAQQPWVRELSPEKQRFVQQVCDAFRDSGAELTPQQKERKTAIEQELAKLCDSFDKNVLDATNAWELRLSDPAALAGMSEDWLLKARERAAAKGYGSAEAPEYLVTLDPTSVYEVLRCCDVESTRRACREGLDTVGSTAPWDNAPLVERIMELRRELAALLGFRGYADMVAAHRMVDSAAKAQAFIYGMMEELRPAFERECRELLDFVGELRGEKVEALAPWDTLYYTRKLMQRTYNFDPEELRPYLSYENVRRGMFALYSHLYDISVRELPSVCLSEGQELPAGYAEVWSPDTQLFAVYDNKTGAHLGSFYLDPFPRATKRAGAWVMPLRYGQPAAGGRPHTPHLAALCGNLTAPVGDKPALLSHSDAETLFHEFGHMLHVMLSDTELRAHSGTRVAWDFVELPSQINENWTWEPEGLALFARHYATGEPLPTELQQRLLASRFFRPASSIMGQLVLARLDFDIHEHYDRVFAGKDLDTATRELLAPWKLPLTQHGPSLMRHFTHCISGGYRAGYYCYKWAEVLQADAFTRFRREGVLNAATGAAFREAVLSKGDSKPAAELFRDFMGRDPNPDALLQEAGILPPSR